MRSNVFLRSVSFHDNEGRDYLLGLRSTCNTLQIKTYVNSNMLDVFKPKMLIVICWPLSRFRLRAGRQIAWITQLKTQDTKEDVHPHHPASAAWGSCLTKPNGKESLGSWDFFSFYW